MSDDHRWNVAAYETFANLRLRPALDLLARAPEPPPGDIVDLGCGAGAAVDALRRRFPGRRIIGVDASPEMLAKAEAEGAYDALEEGDIAAWSPEAPPALIFSNAALHWLPDHRALVPRLFGALRPGGALAVQMPDQLRRPSHETMIAAARRVRPDLFTDWTPFSGPLAPNAYAEILAPSPVDVWTTAYWQELGGGDTGHPVRAFVSSTGGRPILQRLNAAETTDFVAEWDAALEKAYPRRDGGGCWFPFHRMFFVALKP